MPHSSSHSLRQGKLDGLPPPVSPPCHAWRTTVLGEGKPLVVYTEGLVCSGKRLTCGGGELWRRAGVPSGATLGSLHISLEASGLHTRVAVPPIYKALSRGIQMQATLRQSVSNSHSLQLFFLKLILRTFWGSRHQAYSISQLPFPF